MPLFAAFLFWLAVAALALILVVGVLVICILASLTREDQLTILTGGEEVMEEMARDKVRVFATPWISVPLILASLLISTRLMLWLASFFS